MLLLLIEFTAQMRARTHTHAQAHAHTIIPPLGSGFISIELADWPHYDGFVSAKLMRFRLLLSVYLHIEIPTIHVYKAGEINAIARM